MSVLGKTHARCSQQQKLGVVDAFRHTRPTNAGLGSFSMPIVRFLLLLWLLLTITGNAQAAARGYVDNFTSSLGSFIQRLAIADVQTLVGDQYNLTDENKDPVGPGEGSFGRALAHAVVGCGAAPAQDGNCAASALSVVAVSAASLEKSGAGEMIVI